MSNAGQAALSIVGGAVGFVLGGPAGAAWGFQIGSAAGSALFPTDLGTVSGPRLNDLSVQTSTVGAPIPIVYGTYAISGNVIWSSGIIEHVSRKRQGGKGGPTQTVKTYSYTVNCAVGLCEGPIGSVKRIWADAKLIYDVRPQQDGETDAEYVARQAENNALAARMEIHLGEDDQVADPTIESFEGVGNVSAFRDLAYVVFSEFPLEDYGNRIPNFRFEVTNEGIVCQEVTEYSNEVLFPWSESQDDPRDARNAHSYWTFDGEYDPYDTLADAYDARATVLGWSTKTGGDRVYGWHPHNGNETAVETAPYVTLDAAENVQVVLRMNRRGDLSVNSGSYYLGCTAPSTLPLGLYWWPGGVLSGGYQWHGAYHVGPDVASSEAVMGGVANNSFTCSINTRNRHIWEDLPVYVRRVPQAPYDECSVPGEEERPDYFDPAYCVLEDGTIQQKMPWTRVEAGLPNCKALAKYVENNDQYASRQVLQYPLNPIRPNGHADDTQAFWEAAYAAAVTAGDISAGLTYGVHYPVTQTFYYTRTLSICSIDAGGTTLGAIVRDVCLRCGLTEDQVDVSDLTESVDGYVITRVMSGRDAISPLRSYGWFDCVESDGVLKWPTRGKASVFEFSADDLAAHTAGDSRPSSVETDRQQEVELPRRLRVHYAQTEQNYEPGEQGASRLAAGDVQVRDLEVAVAMSDTKGAQIAEVVLYDLWVSRNRIRATVDHSWLDLEPADAGTMPIDGRQERVRIVTMDHALPGLLRLELVRDDDGVYESYAIGAPAAYAGTGGGSLVIVGTADLVLLDLPLLRDSDDDAGYYAAIAALGSTTFSGAVLYRSPDGGTTYEEVASTTEQATIGALASSLPSGPSTIIDEGNELFIDGLSADALESISETSLLAGLNAAAIGDNGRWEIIQFRDAELVSSPGTQWRLTGLLRGRRGTEWAIGSSLDGDRFVLLDSALMRVPMNIAAIGAERSHKGVLVGTSLEATTAVDFTGNAVALKPFSPVSVEGEWDAGDLVITWIRRGRIGQELPSGTDIPLSEASESYEIDILDGEDVIRTLTASSQTVTYTAAQQAADFGSPTPTEITVRIYQLSAVVGRGYAAEATL